MHYLKLNYLFAIHRSLSNTFCWNYRQIIKKSNGPLHSIVDLQIVSAKPKIEHETIDLLEKLSLVNCTSQKSIETLEASVQFADQILQVNVTNTEPLVTLLEDIPLRTREDEITDGNCKNEILKNATVTEDGYFVTPPGNVFLEDKENLLQTKN